MHIPIRVEVLINTGIYKTVYRTQKRQSHKDVFTTGYTLIVHLHKHKTEKAPTDSTTPITLIFQTHKPINYLFNRKIKTYHSHNNEFR